MQDYERNKAIKCIAICFDEKTAIEIALLLNGKANNSKRTAKLSGIK